MATRLAGILLCAALTWVTAGAAACKSGILRMKPFPTDPAPYDSCYPGPIPSRNSIKALCSIAVKVTVTGSGILKWAPLVKGSYRYGPVYGPPFKTVASMNCKDHNASGLFQTASKTAATVMFYDNIGGPLSNLTKASATEVSLSPGATYANQGGPSPCTYIYTVVSGCVLGAKPPPKVPACPAGYILKTGASSTKYCSPCPSGTSSPGPNSSSCTRCAAGTYNPKYGSTCRECPNRDYAAKAGATFCTPCLRDDSSSWSDGKSCADCPAGSFTSPTVKNQCIKCSGGKKCCTVNWTAPSGNCPKCSAASGSTLAPALTSVFALASASPSSCLATKHALCTPKFEITIDGKCLISLSNRRYASTLEVNFESPGCEFLYPAVPILGATPSALVDLAQLPFDYEFLETWLLGNITAAGPSGLTFLVPSTKCLLTYRALTPPAARLLGVPPTPCPLGTPGCPSATNTCPPGRYLETTSTARPAPCILCPPGTYSNKVASITRCTPCAPGTYTRKHGSTKCTKCAAGLVAKAGSATCKPCGSERYRTGANSCAKCPNNTDARQTSCLGGVNGSVCCAAGDCTGQPRCPSRLPAGSSEPHSAVMQLVKRSLPLPACKAAVVLSCLPDNAVVELQSGSGSYMYLELFLTRASKCVKPKPYGSPYYLRGTYLTTKQAYIAGEYYYAPTSTLPYVLVSDKAKGTITMHLSKDGEELLPPPANSCSATFKLVAGRAFDLTPPAGAKCPSNAIPSTINGRPGCKFCGMGSYKNSAGVCASCPAGKFQNVLGATACKPCPAGSVCFSVGTAGPQYCSPGSYSAKAGSAAALCTRCPRNTFASSAGARVCAKCPRLTTAPPGSQACGVFW